MLPRTLAASSYFEYKSAFVVAFSFRTMRARPLSRNYFCDAVFRNL